MPDVPHDLVQQLEMPLGQDEVVPRRSRVDSLGEALEPDARTLAAQPAQLGRGVGLLRGSGGELPRTGVDRRCAQAEVLRDLLDRLGERARDRLPERRRPELSSLGRRGELHDAVEHDAAGRPCRRLPGKDCDRRLELVEQRRDGRVVRARGVDDGQRVAEQDLAIDEARERHELGPRRRECAATENERYATERGGEGLRDPELRVPVVAVEPDGYARAGTCGGVRKLVRKPPLRGRDSRCRRAPEHAVEALVRRLDPSEVVKDRLVDPKRTARQRRARAELDEPPEPERRGGRERVPVRARQHRERETERRPRVAAVLERRDERRDLAVELDGGCEQQHASLERRQDEHARQPVDRRLECLLGSSGRDRRRLTVARRLEQRAEVLDLRSERRVLPLRRRRCATIEDCGHAGTVTNCVGSNSGGSAS